MDHAVKSELFHCVEAPAKQLPVTNVHLFNRATCCSMGNPQSVGRTPKTSLSQALADAVYPQLVEERKKQMFLEDAL